MTITQITALTLWPEHYARHVTSKNSKCIPTDNPSALVQAMAYGRITNFALWAMHCVDIAILRECTIRIEVGQWTCCKLRLVDHIFKHILMACYIIIGTCINILFVKTHAIIVPSPGLLLDPWNTQQWLGNYNFQTCSLLNTTTPVDSHKWSR